VPDKSVPKNIEIHRNPEGLENERSTGEIHYFLCFRCKRDYLHTVVSIEMAIIP